MPAPHVGHRSGGTVVAESLVALGITTVFGEPGQHALDIFMAVDRSPHLRLALARTELSAAFAADGYGRATGTAAALVVSTGPGALMTLPALQEASGASVPLLCVSSQVPRDGLGGSRRGHLHELSDQRASFREVVKSSVTVRQASHIPSALAEAYEQAMTAPRGPVVVEIPEDVLLQPACIPPVGDLVVRPRDPAPRPELVDEAAALLLTARTPVIVAGGGVVRSGASDELLELVRRVPAPVLSTFGGNGAFPRDHALSVQSWCEDRAVTTLLEDADVLLCLGTGLGELTSNYFTLAPRGQLIQVNADLLRLESNHPALGVHGDVGLFLRALIDRLPDHAADAHEAHTRADEVLAEVRKRFEGQDLSTEWEVLTAIRTGTPDHVLTFWDMTIAGYWAWSAWNPRSTGQSPSPQASGVLGYAFPAAVGAAELGKPVLAVSGDGGAMYGLAELATARDRHLPVTWLVIDDGGYGILREYQHQRYGTAAASDLPSPDFVALAKAFGVPARRTSTSQLGDDLAADLAAPGPTLLHLPATLRMFAPS